MNDVERRCRKAYENYGVSSVIWNVTSQCDLNCRHCYIGDEVDISQELDEDEAQGLVSQLGEIGVPLLFLTGGEPLFREDIFDILKSCQENDIITVLSSNGLLLNQEKVNELKRYGVHFNAVSIYGPPKIHDEVVGRPGSFNKIIQGVKNCIENDIQVCFKTVVSNYTYEHLPYIIEKGSQLGVKAFYLCDLIDTGRAQGYDLWRITDEQWRKLAEFLFQKVIMGGEAELDIGACPSIGPLAIQYFREQNYNVEHALKRLNSMSACPVGQGYISINASGDVLPCNFMQDYSLGNIRDKPLPELAQKPLMESLACQKDLKGRCKDCKYKHLCGGCRAKAYVKTGDITQEDHTCIMESTQD